MCWPSYNATRLFGICLGLSFSTNLAAQPASPVRETIETEVAPQALLFAPESDDLIIVGEESILLSELTDDGRTTRAIWQADGKPLLVAVARGAQPVAIYSLERGIQLVDRQNHEAPHTLDTGEIPELISLQFNLDGNRLVARTAANQVLSWWVDVPGLGSEYSLPTFKGPVAIDSDGDFAVGELANDGLVVWDIAAESRRYRLEGAAGSVSAVAISPSGKYIAGALASDEQSVQVWDAKSGQLLLVLHVPGENKVDLRFSHDELSLTVVDSAGKITVWEVPFKLPLGEFQLPNEANLLWAVNSDGSRVAFGTGNTIVIAPIEGKYRRPGSNVAERPTYTVSAPMEYRAETWGEDEEVYAEAGEAAEAAEEMPPDFPSAPADETAGPPLDEPAAEEPATGDTASPDPGPTANGHRAPDSEEAAERPREIEVLFGTNRASDRGAKWREYFAGFFFTWVSVLLYVLLILGMIVAGLTLGRRAVRRVAAGFGVALVLLGAAYATVKSNQRFQLPGDEYGGQLMKSGLLYGSCLVTIPPEHVEGRLESPGSIWVIRGSEDPQEHVTIAKLETCDADAFLGKLRTQLASADSKDVVVFIHGYNVSFRDALRRTAQLKFDMQFPGPGICFSWPSHADPVRYFLDDSNAENSEAALRDFLNHVANSREAGRIHVIAHSMGNRVLTGALPLISQDTRKRIGYVVLAAPDIPRTNFLDPIAGLIAAAQFQSTLYVSANDRALQLSKYFRKAQRAGERDPDLTLCDGFETIDASAVDTSLLGHSYYGDIPSVIDDLAALILEGKSAAQRLAEFERQSGDRRYWQIPP